MFVPQRVRPLDQCAVSRPRGRGGLRGETGIYRGNNDAHSGYARLSCGGGADRCPDRRGEPGHRTRHRDRDRAADRSAAGGRTAESGARTARGARGLRRAGLRRADGGRRTPGTGGGRDGLSPFPEQGRAGQADSRGRDSTVDRTGAGRAGPGGGTLVGALPLPAYFGRLRGRTAVAAPDTPGRGPRGPGRERAAGASAAHVGAGPVRGGARPRRGRPAGTAAGGTCSGRSGDRRGRFGRGVRRAGGRSGGGRPSCCRSSGSWSSGRGRRASCGRT